MKRLFAIIVVLLTTLLGSGAGASEILDGLPDGGQKIIAQLDDAAIGSECQLILGNNESVYPENMLLIIKGRLGEHDGDLEVYPIERGPNDYEVIEFTATGGAIFATVFYERFTSMTAAGITCNAPPSTTTTVASTTTTEPATTTTRVPPPSELPRTGLNSDLLNVALVLLALGGFLGAVAAMEWDDD